MNTVNKYALQDHIMKAMKGCLRAGDEYVPAIRELRNLYDHIERGYFDSPSESQWKSIADAAADAVEQVQVEIEGLRSAIKEAMEKEWELAGEPTPVYTILHQALSTSTEPTGPSKSSMGLMLDKEDTNE